MRKVSFSLIVLGLVIRILVSQVALCQVEAKKSQTASNSRPQPLSNLAKSQDSQSPENAHRSQDSSNSIAPAPPVRSSSSGASPEIFFDANQSEFDRSGETHRFEGNVVAIASQVLISADLIEYEKTQHKLHGQGHVIIVTPSQLLSGSSFTLDLVTNEFVLKHAAISSNDHQSSEKVLSALLGFSEEELDFEQSRNLRLKELLHQKERLRQQFRLSQKIFPNEETIEIYTKILAKEHLIKTQSNIALRKKSKEARDSYIRRREFWTKKRSMINNVSGSLDRLGYFVVRGETIHRSSSKGFSAEKAFFSPCLCEENENPPWGFRANSISAQVEGYADFYDSILEIKGVPILYLPYMKVPLKSKRQPGFLLPSVSHSSASGTMYSQPVFFTFDDQSDATVQSDYFEKRGLRLGLEYRIQSKKHSGWQFNAEAIRDRSWLQQMEKRRQTSERYTTGLDIARQHIVSNPSLSSGFPIDHSEYMDLTDPGWWKSNGFERCLEDSTYNSCVEHEIKNHLHLPSNTWRGKLSWRGQSILAPRLSIVSHGNYLSDHRYHEDLWMPDSANPRNRYSSNSLYSTTKTRLHLDAENFYLGIGSNFSDPTLALEKYSGYQIPVFLKFVSKQISILDSYLPLPLYLQSSIEQRRIEVFSESKFDRTLPRNQLLQRLGNGNWQRLDLKLKSPLISDQIVSADLFSDFECRRIETDRLYRTHHDLNDLAISALPDSKIGTSYLHSIVSGIHFGLPLDGAWESKPFYSITLDDKKETNTVVEHRMSWDMTLSLRSYAAKRGRYGETREYMEFSESSSSWEEIEKSRCLSYYVSDQKIYPSQIVTFSTTHSWHTFDESWNLAVGKMEKISNLQSLEKNQDEIELYQRMREQAQHELLHSLDRLHTSVDDLINEDGTWSSNRYTLNSSNHLNPVMFTSSISFDYRKLKSREDTREINRREDKDYDLPEPWTALESKLNVKYSDWDLYFTNEYNLYKKIFPKLTFRLKTPTYQKSAISLSYNIINEPLRGEDGQFYALTTRTREFSFTSKIIPNFQLSLGYGIQEKEGSDPRESGSVTAVYSSPTLCWGLKSGWSKEYSDKTWNDGTYLVGLVINFFSGSREFGNLVSRYNQG